MIEPLRLIGWVLFVLSIPVIRIANRRLVEQEEKESPDIHEIFKGQLMGRAGILFFLSGFVLIVNGGGV